MHESGENYLETILMLQNKNGFVRSIDIANELEYTKPSISRAMGILRKNGYITMDDGGQILLTELGRKKAEEIYERHLLITKFLMETLGIERQLADKDACRIEHVISQETFERIKAKVE
ncbi:metal-dependent transcriptional regulator [Youxingia wuxianensis]|uniref:Metal-dependent transcriptional regulator n=1 Tax=Youxingia wuxianensis TaxID=2763678 RepID=A0A926ES75_9FIRM|nr:metal-dependent transcriptional regulator [Youxingia wuxianensis]MBC8586487.1 metal-dependent transcriptional regulator [Youxingia wuxianensis]